jgi:hypothetical protein
MVRRIDRWLTLRLDVSVTGGRRGVTEREAPHVAGLGQDGLAVRVATAPAVVECCVLCDADLPRTTG